MQMNRLILLFLLILIKLSGLHAQEPDTLPKTVPGKIIDGDTVPVVEIKSVNVFPPHEFKNRRQEHRFTRLVYNVKKVYPYARLAGEKLKEFQLIMDTIKTEHGKRQFAREAQKMLEDEFGDEIKDLTFSQGKILIKLIYRQTGNSSFDIVQELRGKFTAFIWQTLASLFGYNLKTGYDPEGEDRQIEEIILLIDQGYF